MLPENLIRNGMKGAVTTIRRKMEKKCNFLKGGKPWNWGLRKETSQAVRRWAKKLKENHWSRRIAKRR